jgi:penicillin-binding protein 1A
MTEGLSLALGTNLVTPIQLVTAYATFANGGFLVMPFMIDHITDHDDKLMKVATPHFACEPCTPDWVREHFSEPLAQIISADRVISPQNAYIMNDMLRDVVKRGTGQGALKLKREDVGGKTGTTNDKKDGWFSGFGGGIVTTTWIGYDTPQSLGEFAAQSALPTWIKFMQIALENRPEVLLPEPQGIVKVRVNTKTGLLVQFDEPTGEMEIFYEGTEPSFNAPAPNTIQELMNTESPDNSLF